MSNKINLDKLFDFLNLEALADEKKINDIKRLIAEMVWDRSKKNRRYDIFKEHKLQHIVDLMSGVETETGFYGNKVYKSILKEDQQAELREKIVYAVNVMGDIVKENGIDYQEMNEASPYTSTELNFHNWFGFNNRSIVINDAGEVKWSRTGEAKVGQILDAARQAKLKKRGFIIHVSKDQWR